jgi:hypothetical protein
MVCTYVHIFTFGSKTYSDKDVEYHAIYLCSACHVHEDLNEIYINNSKYANEVKAFQSERSRLNSYKADALSLSKS